MTWRLRFKAWVSKLPQNDKRCRWRRRSGSPLNERFQSTPLVSKGLHHFLMPPLAFGSLPLEVHLAISSLLIQLSASFLRSPAHLIQASSDRQSLSHNRNGLHRNEKSRRDGNDKTYGLKARTPICSCRNFNRLNRHDLILAALWFASGEQNDQHLDSTPHSPFTYPNKERKHP